MNTCRWCGSQTNNVSFCTTECASAAAEMPELISNRSAAPAPVATPRRLASPRRTWFLGLTAGALLGIGTTLALNAPPQARPHAPQCATARTKAQVKSVAMDFLTNGLAGIWDGRVDSSEDLSKWFLDLDATDAHMNRIFRDQARRQGTQLLEAEIVDVRLNASLDHAETEFFLRTDEPRGQRCYTGTFQWINQDNGEWLRAKASELRGTPCR